MRRALLALSSTIAGLVMLLSFKTQATTVATPPAAVGTPAPDAGTSPSSASTTPAAGSGGSRTVTGTASQTRYGPVQVQITITDGTVTDVTAVEYPQSNPRDAEINAYAVPQLNQEASAAKSADIDIVSGATYTSQGYLESLQSALDMAGL